MFYFDVDKPRGTNKDAMIQSCFFEFSVIDIIIKYITL